MLRFRPRLTPLPSVASPPDLLAVGQAIDDLMQPGHFFVAQGLHLRWTEARAEDVPWEIFRGCLVPAAQTRQRARFLSWHITDEGADEPMLSVRLDVNAGVVHVTRGILCYVWEGYDAGGGVIDSREVQRWTRELVGSAELHRFADLDELRDELTCLIWQAVVGTSRLPLHSVEAPLPAFSLGQMHYVYRPWNENTREPATLWQTLIDDLGRSEMSLRERAKAFEVLLRHLAPDDVRQAAQLYLAQGFADAAAVRLMRTMFNQVSLSPYTNFTANSLAFLYELALAAALPPGDYPDFLGYLLRQLGCHLTAYDLITFHHRGANFPDALLLDAVLADYLNLIAMCPEWFHARDMVGLRRRRALRQGCLSHRQYEGHQVPDMPTSPGENARVLPAPHARVPEEQLLNPERRMRRLFNENSIANLLHSLGPLALKLKLEQSLQDLRHVSERTELGIGLFIDRPLGYGKAAGEPDLTPMLAHEAFSPSIARSRFQELMKLASELSLDLPPDFAASMMQALDHDAIAGVAAARLAVPARPTAALADVRRVADDFVIMRTLPGGLGEMLRLFDFSGVQARFDLPMLRDGQQPRVVAMVQSPRGPALGFFDDDYQCRLECVVDQSGGFMRRAGIELPVAGLRVGSEDIPIRLVV